MTLAPRAARLELDRRLPSRARVRRWSNEGGPASFAATAHPGVEIAWIDKGGVRYRVAGRSVELSPGQVMLVPSGVEHASEFLQGMAGGSVHLDDALVAHAQEAFGGAALLPGLIDGVDVRALGAMLVDELGRDGADARLCASALVDALAVKAVRGARVPAMETTTARDPRVRAAIELMRGRFTEPLDVDEIAAVCGTSRFHLSRLFKAATGISPYQFLLDVRLDEAARALRSGRSVTDAALSSGFTDLSRFARMFKKKHGALPKQYAAQ